MVLRVLDTCGDSEACVLEEDDHETGAFFTASANATYTVVLEAYNPGFALFDFSIDEVLPEDCGDAQDNDRDDRVDCADDDCFGDTTDCATETICHDGEDNDLADGADCADPDCADDLACVGGVTVFSEGFDTWVPADWTIGDYGLDSPTWKQSNTCGGAGEFPDASGPFALVETGSLASVSGEALTSPSLDLSTYGEAALRFNHRYLGRTAGHQSDYGTLTVLTGGGTQSEQLRMWGHEEVASESVWFDLTSVAAGESQVQLFFFFGADGGSGYHWCLDTVEVLAR